MSAPDMLVPLLVARSTGQKRSSLAKVGHEIFWGSVKPFKCVFDFFLDAEAVRLGRAWIEELVEDTTVFSPAGAVRHERHIPVKFEANGVFWYLTGDDDAKGNVQISHMIDSISSSPIMTSMETLFHQSHCCDHRLLDLAFQIS